MSSAIVSYKPWHWFSDSNITAESKDCDLIVPLISDRWICLYKYWVHTTYEIITYLSMTYRINKNCLNPYDTLGQPNQATTLL